jgi:hypothetical protein
VWTHGGRLISYSEKRSAILPKFDELGIDSAADLETRPVKTILSLAETERDTGDEIRL